jgi:hypothetical protein
MTKIKPKPKPEQIPELTDDEIITVILPTINGN